MTLFAMLAEPDKKRLDIRSTAGLSAVVLIAVIAAVVLFAAPALAETVHLGPASVYLDMATVPEPYVVTGDASREVHNLSNEDLGCTKLWALGFSPDGDGGSGRFIFLCGARICQNCTVALFESFRVSLEDARG